MENNEKRIWGIHTKDDKLFLHQNVIAIAWKDMGDLGNIVNDRDAFKGKYTEVYPDAKKGSIANGAGMLYRFTYEVEIGDYVVFPSKINRQINIGVIVGGYEYNSSETEYVQQHKVKWLKHLPRTFFSQGALYEVGSAMSFFAIKNYVDEYLAALDKNFKKSTITTGPEEDESVGTTANEIVESTKDFILKELGNYNTIFKRCHA